MTDFYAAFSKPERPATTPAPVQAVNADRAGRYALAAFTAEVDAVRYCGEGGRNHQLNTSAYKLARFIGAGDLAYADVRGALRNAGLDAGLEPAEIDKTLDSALGAGVENERVIPDLPEREDDLSAWESYLREPLTSGSRSGTAPSSSDAASTPITASTVSPAATTTTTESSSGFEPPSNASPATTTTSDLNSPSSVDGSTNSKPDSNSHPSDPSSPTASPVAEPSPSPTAASSLTTTGLTPADVAWITDQALRQAVVDTQRRREAARIVAAIEGAKDFRVPPSEVDLRAELALPRDPEPYLLDRLIPEGGNVLFAATHKAGKTSTINNLAKAFADQVPFLGQFTPQPLDGRVGIFNYEVERSQYARWLDDIGIEHPERISTLPLRGYRLPLTVPMVEQWVVDWLIDHDVKVWIVDPFAPAYGGDSENDNAEVSRFLNTLDVIVERAGIRSLVMPAHTGRPREDGPPATGPERVRGATRLDDWADVRWFLARDGDSRFFSATGRDVEVAEGELRFDPVTRALTYDGRSRYQAKTSRVEDAMHAHALEHPGCSKAQLLAAVAAAGGPKQRAAAYDLIDGAVSRGLLRVEEPEKAGTAARYYAGRAPHVTEYGPPTVIDPSDPFGGAA